jgi:beta-phosphoglucomutase family hydrolase
MLINNSSLLESVKANKKVEALIFDMDGTLVDTLPVHYEAWIKACSEYGIDFSMDYFRKLTGRPVTELSKDIVEKFNIPIHPKELAKRKEALVEGQFHRMKVFPFMLEILNSFHNKLPMAVGTGSRKEMANTILKTANIAGFFDNIVTSDDVNQFKPHPETFLKSAHHFGVQPENCLVFEDGQLGIEAAKAAGMMVVDVKAYY